MVTFRDTGDSRSFRCLGMTQTAPHRDGLACGSFDLGSVGMPAHDVTMNLSHPITVKNVDVEFEVRLTAT